MRKLILTLLTVMLGMTCFAYANATPEEFLSGNKFYDEKDYESAIRMYESVLAQGNESAELYFNLGNAHFKSGDLGCAVLYYLKARRLSPEDEDIRHNLEFARRFSSVQMEGVELNPINTFFRTMVDSYRIATLAWVVSAFFLLFMGVLIVRFGLGIKGGLVKSAVIISLLLLLISAGLTSFKYRVDYLNRTAVIIAEESPVLTGPSDQSDIELQGAPGLVVEILDESGDYFNVLFENKRRGWINKELVAEI